MLALAAHAIASFYGGRGVSDGVKPVRVLLADDFAEWRPSPVDFASAARMARRRGVRRIASYSDGD